MAVAKPVADALDRAEAAVKEAIELSLNEIREESNNEKEYIDLWVSCCKRIGTHFQSEADRTGNRQLARYIRRNLTKAIFL
ncbi:hypothetical protein SAMN02745823_00814 [Sporobacter termitidis DSM 10068]|uniref:Uncharacterized protein n=1 Tax=Sporobacter termitidis DSM 10068 TaxID=1123282 RepID=A0A1M5VH49_9FIRM|nr:hypothetical protein [Sporobacter termitidis]SHH74253.1 hypothetical protein SAMN02745823_00814 [Sporobacter termitidis DSM 10068]